MTSKIDFILIRKITDRDIEQVCNLCEELGYPCSTDQLTTRWRNIREAKDQEILVAVAESKRVAGWIHVGEVHHLTCDPRAEIFGLVVASENRGRGIGSQLVEHAKNWASMRGLSVIRLSSQIKRKRAHSFYEKLGFKLTKTSHVFVNAL